MCASRQRLDRLSSKNVVERIEFHRIRLAKPERIRLELTTLAVYFSGYQTALHYITVHYITLQ